jgi:hypothetical protein
MKKLRRKAVRDKGRRTVADWLGNFVQVLHPSVNSENYCTSYNKLGESYKT